MGAALPGICIFCKNSGNFTEKEFIVPQALGNKKDVLQGMVCGSCIKKLSSGVVKPVMEKSLLRKKLGHSILTGLTGSSAASPYSNNELKLLGRMLGKMGMEYLALSDPLLALNPHFDDIRGYILNEFQGNSWTIYKGDRNSPVKFDTEKRYKYSLGMRGTDEYIFLFSTAESIMLISLTNMLPDEKIIATVSEVELKILYQ